jgi:hypothetical protein
MKKWMVRLLLLVVLAGVGYWVWTFFFPPPERIIRQRLLEVARLVSFSPKEGSIAKLANAQKLTSFFTDDLEVTIDIARNSRKTFSGRDELLQAAIGARNMISSFNVEFFDITVVVSPDKTSATVNLTANGSVAGEKDSIVQELKFSLKKIGNNWIINRIETVKTLSQFSPINEGTNVRAAMARSSGAAAGRLARAGLPAAAGLDGAGCPHGRVGRCAVAGRHRATAKVDWLPGMGQRV